MVVIGASEASPSLLGGVKSEDLVRFGSRGTTWLHSIYGWLLACLLLWPAHDHRFACLPRAKCQRPLVRMSLVWCS